MARLYIMHEPTDIPVEVGVLYGVHGADNHRQSFYVDSMSEASDYDVVYLVVVHKGRCWAAREKMFFKSGKRMSLACVPWDDGPNTKRILLKDHLLGD